MLQGADQGCANSACWLVQMLDAIFVVIIGINLRNEVVNQGSSFVRPSLGSRNAGVSGWRRISPNDQNKL
jgi:hypothetical protein